MIVEKMLFLLFIVVAIVYYFDLYKSIGEIKKNHKNIWISMGSPDLFSPNGQFSYLRFVFVGFKKVLMPEKLRIRIERIRILLVLGMLLFLMLIIVHSIK